MKKFKTSYRTREAGDRASAVAELAKVKDKKIAYALYRVLLADPAIKVRMAAIDHESWNPPAAYPAEPVKSEDRVGYSAEIEAGRWDVDDVVRPIYEEASEALGQEFKYPGD